jgi:hypothetical protein
MSESIVGMYLKKKSVREVTDPLFQEEKETTYRVSRFHPLVLVIRMV